MTKNTTLSVHFQNQITKSQKEATLTHTYMTVWLSWLVTGTPIQSVEYEEGCVKLHQVNGSSKNVH